MSLIAAHGIKAWQPYLTPADIERYLPCSLQHTISLSWPWHIEADEMTVDAAGKTMHTSQNMHIFVWCSAC